MALNVQPNENVCIISLSRYLKKKIQSSEHYAATAEKRMINPCLSSGLRAMSFWIVGLRFWKLVYFKK